MEKAMLKWAVSQDADLGVVLVKATCGTWITTSRSWYFVSAPNVIERLLGITYENKINKAIIKCQMWCDEQNKKEKISADAISSIRLREVCASCELEYPECGCWPEECRRRDEREKERMKHG